MRLFLRLFGSEVFDFQIGEPEYDESEYGIAAGETQNFERDGNPLNPADHYGDYEDRFGFNESPRPR